jgi:hemerythrin superfamily protein
MSTLTSSKSKNAITLLKEDHKKVKAFKEYEGLGDKAYRSKEKLVSEICSDLLAHMVAEEKVFYPTVAPKIKNGESLIDEGIVEHAAAKNLILKLKNMRPEDEFYDPTVKVLSEQIDHHVKEEENDIFPLVLKTDLDLEALGKEIEEVKHQVE